MNFLASTDPSYPILRSLIGIIGLLIAYFLSSNRKKINPNCSWRSSLTAHNRIWRTKRLAGLKIFSVGWPLVRSRSAGLS